MIDKSIRQAQSLQCWKNNNRKGTLNLTPRFGKTLTAKKCIEDCIDDHQTCCLNILLIAPNAVTLKNIKENMIPDRKDVQVDVFSLMQLNNMIKRGETMSCYDLIVIDEIHNVFNGDFINVVINLRGSYKLGLTGSTLTNSQMNTLSALEFPVIDIITSDEAIENGWISNFIEYNVPVELTDMDKVRYADATKVIKEHLKNWYKAADLVNNTIFGFKALDSDFDLLLSCYTGKNITLKNGVKRFIKPNVFRNMVADVRDWTPYMSLDNEYNCRIDQYWNPEKIAVIAKNFNECIRSRNDILIRNVSKINAVKSIIAKFDCPTIVFNESTGMADDLESQFVKGGIAYHSNIQTQPRINPLNNDYYRSKNGKIKNIGLTSLLKIIVEGMRNGVYKYLFCAKALNEGLTIENIELVITTGGTTNPVKHEQRTARGKNLDYQNPNKLCRIINLYVDDFTLDDNLIISRDKQKLISRQANNSVEPLWIDSIDDIE